MKAHSATHQHDKKSIFQFLPGPVKIKDGLFLGDEIAARDIEFIISNKVTHIINTVSKQIPNLWERFGIHYLSVNWTQKEQNIFDKKNNAVNTIFHFVEEAMEQGQSCLIHSVNGKSRACAVLVAYLMKKYTWSLNKCLQFIASKKENLEIRNSFLVQMQELQQRMSQIYNLTSEWDQSKNQEELVLRNTLINSKSLEQQKTEEKIEKKGKKKVSWEEKLVVIQKSVPQKTLTNFKEGIKTSQAPLKSILKGDPGTQETNNKESQKDDFSEFEQIQPSKVSKNEGSFINNINGNIVHVTVNNFITSDKKSEIQGKNIVNTRPYSSDQKDRDKEKKILNPKKLAYDTNALLSFKSPYDAKLVGNRTRNSNIKPVKKEEKQKQSKNVASLMPYQRPQSAKSRSIAYTNVLKDDLIVTNGLTNAYNLNKKRFASNPREELFKKK